MAEKLNLDNDVHDLKFGKSFDSNQVAFHSIRYDFKPESLDSSRSSNVMVGNSNSVEVSVPHVQGSGTSHTTYKGNKRPIQKECVLIIDHSTGEFTLEKLSNTIQLKKTRVEGSSKASRPDPSTLKRPHTPSEQKKKEIKTSPKSSKSGGEQTKATQPPLLKQEPAPMQGELSSQSSDSSCESDSDSDAPPTAPVQSNSQPVDTNSHFAHLSHDLMLSDSGSDSD